LAKLADHRDSDTGRHLDRICAYSRLLAEAIRDQRPEIDDQWIERLTLASSMHDIGKVGVPDRILLKPGTLTHEEFDVMKRHPLIGADTLIAIRERMGDDELLRMSIEVALSHHERWDGSGYPFGLAGEQIPLSGRIVALADVYDALTSKRVYKEAFPHARAVAIIRSESGKQFDPMLVEAFERVSDGFDGIRRELQADPTEMRVLRERYEAA
jgi:putative two-component system response regulator